ncbi:MAG: hypothetical protein E7250_05350 [Paenibacillaceae bacterium]|nr:hypothetical protein [Paenibacillaceae bacterium]
MGLLDEDKFIKIGEKSSLLNEDKIWNSIPKNQYLQPNLNLEPDKEVMRNIKESAEHIRKSQDAQIKTAQNTDDIKGLINTVIINQFDYINMLKEYNNHILQELQNIFGSSEDSVIVQKEILKMMKEQNVNEDLLKDKGMDAFIQALFMFLNLYLGSKGIKL